MGAFHLNFTAHLTESGMPTTMRLHAFVLLFLFAAGLHAEPVALISDEEKLALQEEIRITKARASALNEEAERVFKETETACYKKFLVSDCLDQAREAHRNSLREARAVESKGKTLERELKMRDFATHRVKLEEDAKRKDAEAAERAEKNRLAQEAAEKRVAEKAGK